MKTICSSLIGKFQIVGKYKKGKLITYSTEWKFKWKTNFTNEKTEQKEHTARLAVIGIIFQMKKLNSVKWWVEWKN